MPYQYRTTGGDCGCGPSCPPQPAPPPSGSCPCGDSFRQALDLLCSQQFYGLVDFGSFAFVSDYFLLGASIEAPAGGSQPGDNLTALSATYRCGSCGCETAAASGPLFPPTVGGLAQAGTVSQAALCRLTAVAFDAADDTSLTNAANYQAIAQIFTQLLRPAMPQTCVSIADSLTTGVTATATVAAGPLLVENALVLGQLGKLLVLANSTDGRFYLVCADKIDFIG